MSFYQKLAIASSQNNSLICIGLDLDPERMPDHLRATKEGCFDFNRQIIDATADLVCAYKPQIAYYAAYSMEAQLLQTIDYLKDNYPHIPIILDAKRGDIDSTAKMYAREAFVRYQADAVTVNPYLGGDTLQPFFNYKEHGVFILCRTSNPGSGEFQTLSLEGKTLFVRVAEKAAKEWNKNKNIGLVVGATYPQDLAVVREVVGPMPLLIPGVGTQGGDIEAVMKNGLLPDKTGLVINASRSILYASQGTDFANAARMAAQKLKEAINRLR